MVLVPVGQAVLRASGHDHLLQRALSAQKDQLQVVLVGYSSFQPTLQGQEDLCPAVGATVEGEACDDVAAAECSVKHTAVDAVVGHRIREMEKGNTTL